MLSLDFDVDVKHLQDSLISRIPNSGTQTVVTLIRDLIIEQFEKKLKNLVTTSEIIRIKVETPQGHFHYNQLKSCLNDLAKQKTIYLGYIVATIVTAPACEIRLETPANLLWLMPIEFKSQLLKTVQKNIIRMRSVGIQSDVIEGVSSALYPDCQCKSDSLVPYINGVWDWALRFICKICGRSYFCDCFKKAVDIYYPKALAEQSRYGEGGWPQKFISAYKQSEFKSGICHICRDTPSELFYCHPMYGSKVMVHYGPYIVRTAIEKGISQRVAENEIRDLLGISHIGEGWISEVELLKMVRDIFPSEKVIHQASPTWLGLQRIDILLPNLKLAIEYQGRQHYESVQFFGGEEGFLHTQERDKRKSSKCAENGITLVYFHYNEEINRKMIEARLRNAIAGSI